MVARESLEANGTVGAPDAGFDPASVDAAFERTLARRDEVRARLMGAIPSWYAPWGHLAATVGIGVVVLLIAVSQIHGLHASQLLIVPITVVISNYFEYRVHKKILHKRWWLFRVLYDRHTPEHHIVFVESDMPIRSTREFKLVLIPAVGVLGIVLATAPMALVFGHFVSANVGWVFLVTSAFMMISYELLHLSYHLPPDTFIGGSRLIGVLRRHHARHHDPRLMQKWNFNVTLPLFDWVFGTIHRR